MALWLIIMLAVSPPASLFGLVSMHEDERKGETCKSNLKNIFNGINSAVNYTDILMSYFASVC